MPRAAKHVLRWSAEAGGYQLHEQDHSPRLLAPGDEAAWHAWLDAHAALAFAGQAGRVNLLKEARKGNTGYWYAYRRHGGRVVKRYLGRSAELSLARLEAVCAELARPPAPAATEPPTALVPQPIPAPPVPPRAASSTLLTPKLQLPRLPAGLVSRERLFLQLDLCLERKLTLLTAPAGFGKTTLVRQWLHQWAGARSQGSGSCPPAPRSPIPDPAIAWLSLDDGDNDPMRFWRYVIGACQTFQSEIGASALALLSTMLQPPFTPLPHEMLLTPLLNDLSQQTRHSILVLEDYHLINERQVHAAMSFFLDHLPAALHLVILTRSEPPLPLARLRASGDVCDILAADLRFSLQETQHFLEESSVAPLALQSIDQIAMRLEGWAAGLRLLTLALQGRQAPGDIAHVLATFAGSHRPLLDYFVAEVLDLQPPAVQGFLLRTAVLDRLTGALCDAVLANEQTAAGHHASSAVLEELTRANLFIEPLDGDGAWYRYHALFADAMRHEARRRLGADVLAAVSAQASTWYEQHGLLSEAIEAALRARRPLRAAQLLDQLVSKRVVSAFQPFAAAHEAHTLQRWLELIPKAMLRQHPLLCMNYAIVLLLAMMEGRVKKAPNALIEEVLHMAEEGFRASDHLADLGEVFTFRSLFTRQLGAIEKSVAWARQALAVLPVESFAWRGASLSAIGAGEAFAGRLSLARQLLLEARAISEAAGNSDFSRAIIGMLSAVYVEQGDLHRAAGHLRQSLAEARTHCDRDDVGHAQLALMQLSYQWNDLGAAEQQAREAYAVGVEFSDQEFMSHASLMLAWLAHVRGHTAVAQDRVAELLEQLQPPQSPRVYWYMRAARALQARLYLAAGDILAAQRWADALAQDDASIPYFQRAREQLLVARVLLAQHKHESARTLLAECFQTAQQAGHTYCALETQVSLAVVYAASKQPQEARNQLLAAITAAAGEGYIRLFVDEGAVLEPVLRASLAALREPSLAAYAATLLRACAAEQAPPADVLLAALSPQEQRVLQWLVAGCTNAQIATHLIVSVNTVKAHLKNIYRKLNVTTRLQASQAAQWLGVGVTSASATDHSSRIHESAETNG